MPTITAKAYDAIMKKVTDYNEFGDLRTADECDKAGRWSPVDLVIRETLNNGGGSAQGFLGITTEECLDAYAYICEHKQEMIDAGLISETGKNNHGFYLWMNYDFKPLTM